MTAFREGQIQIDDLRIRYLEAGAGAPLVHLQSAGTLHVTPAHDLLSRRFRVVVVEMPEPARSPELAPTMDRAIGALGVDAFDLLAGAEACLTAIRLALLSPARVRALVLEAPTLPRPGEPGGADLETRLGGLITPTLLLFGTTDERARPAAGGRHKELIPNSHLVFVYDAGHAIGADRPEAFAEVVADFVERHEAFVISRADTLIHP